MGAEKLHDLQLLHRHQAIPAGSPSGMHSAHQVIKMNRSHAMLLHICVHSLFISFSILSAVLSVLCFRGHCDVTVLIKL